MCRHYVWLGVGPRLVGVKLALAQLELVPRVMDAVNAVGKLVFIVLITFFSFEAYSSFQKLRDSKIAVSTSKQFSATRY